MTPLSILAFVLDWAFLVFSVFGALAFYQACIDEIKLCWSFKSYLGLVIFASMLFFGYDL
ncbi:MAG: hypothetical protein CMI18_05950 [Opitutaceae bacterium]|nr:hypothetical protein [Opitutaceae bacterium]